MLFTCTLYTSHTKKFVALGYNFTFPLPSLKKIYNKLAMVPVENVCYKQIKMY